MNKYSETFFLFLAWILIFTLPFTSCFQKKEAVKVIAKAETKEVVYQVKPSHCVIIHDGSQQDGKVSLIIDFFQDDKRIARYESLATTKLDSAASKNKKILAVLQKNGATVKIKNEKLVALYIGEMLMKEK